MSDSVRELAIESWTLYACGLLLIVARIASRRLFYGSFKKLRIDDWIMLFISLTFTGVIVSVNQVSTNLSNYLAPGVFETLTPKEVENAIFGSKMVLVLEEFMLTTTWLVKACLLLLLAQITVGSKQNLAVKYLGLYCAVSYVLIQVLYLSVWCRPIQQYWAVPVENSQCASYYHHLTTATVFNISSDLAMLAISLWIFIELKLPLKRKLILCGVFSLGVFVILAAILNRYYNFTEPYGSLVYLNWYVGESATSVFVANVPLLWPLLGRMFALSPFGGSRRNKSNLTPGLSDRYQSSSGRRMNRTLDEHERSESEERITNGVTNSWGAHPHANKGPVELDSIHADNGYTATVVGGKDEGAAEEGGGGGWEAQRKYEDGNIVKTIEIQHYSH